MMSVNNYTLQNNQQGFTKQDLKRLKIIKSSYPLQSQSQAAF